MYFVILREELGIAAEGVCTGQTYGRTCRAHTRVTAAVKRRCSRPHVLYRRAVCNTLLYTLHTSALPFDYCVHTHTHMREG